MSAASVSTSWATSRMAPWCDSWMNGNAQGGARFANSAAGGVASDLEWMGGGFRKTAAPA